MFIAFIKLGEEPVCLSLDESKWKLRKQGLKLMIITCSARNVGPFALLTFIGLMNHTNNLKDTEGPSNVSSIGRLSVVLGGSSELIS